VNPIDDQAIRRRLHAEFGSLEISPAPVIAVTRRGKAIRGRRRAVASGLAAVAVVAVLAVRAAQGPAPAVTVNAPRPGAPGGVFASGTANGKPWRMAVRNIAADPGTRWCLPAVMFNGRDGDVLFKSGPEAPAFGNPAFIPRIPGFPGIGAVFTQVAPEVTRLVATFPGGRRLTVHPVWVRACTQRFHLAGFVFALPGRGVSTLATYTESGFGESLKIDFRVTGRRAGPGLWADWDVSGADIIAASRADIPIGTGAVAGMTWRIRTGLGVYGQCYAAELWGVWHGRYGRGQSSECVPVAAPPPTIALSWVSVPDATANLTGYAGPVNPRTRGVLVSISDGTTRTVRPVNVAGRAYVAFVVPPGCRVIRLSLTQAGGAVYATTSALPPAR
jgi:hypothetical protein